VLSTKADEWRLFNALGDGGRAMAKLFCKSVANRSLTQSHSALGSDEARNLSSHTTCSPTPAAAAAQFTIQPCDRDGFRNRVSLTI